MVKLPIPKPLFDTLENISADFIGVASPSFAPKDYKTALEFLNQYNGNKSTFEAYRREVERLLQWSWLIAKKSALSLKRQDVENYLKFCLNPHKSWIGLKRVPRFICQSSQRIPNPQWRPFVATVNKINYKKGLLPNKEDYQLSRKSVQEIFTNLSSFYHYLIVEEIISVNPIALIKQKSKYLQKRQIRASVMRLTEKQWETCMEVTRTMADKEPLHERTLFILTALYLLYLRISELVASPRWTPQNGTFLPIK